MALNERIFPFRRGNRRKIYGNQPAQKSSMMEIYIPIANDNMRSTCKGVAPPSSLLPYQKCDPWKQMFSSLIYFINRTAGQDRWRS
ncbi:Uncharacterized protein TCM_026672 [Theobroma cacao]|uniref:Uncharacterized protein n=1 Tax=Theobroma cacao TaxID=3641 RepID=A0A061F4A9_THECC|nr:Uncharacterized protein TCM_026672 [Theobroma cacao]